MKLPTLIIVMLILILSIIGLVFNNSGYNSEPTKLSNVIIDSIKNKDNNLSLFTSNYRVSVQISTKIKYYSNSDTIIIMYDTTGIMIGSPIRFVNLAKEDQYRLSEILLLTK